VCHRDLKVENILYKQESFKIGDFGSCTEKFKIDYKTASKNEIHEFLSVVERESTNMYRAPELVNRYSASYADEQVDVWALGCILYVLCSGQSHPF
jgi:AP2-associated kinase